MMQNPVRAIVIRVGPTNNANERQVLTVRAGNGIEHTQPSDREGDDAGADTTNPRVAIGSVSSVQFIATADQVELGLGQEVVEQGEVEVPRNRKDIVDSHLDQSARDVAAEG